MIPEPPLFIHWYDFSKWLLVKIDTFPKKVRMSFCNRIADLTLNIIEGIIDARYSRKKGELLHQIDLNMEKLQVLLRMCHDLAYLDHKGYEFTSKKINEAGRMVGGWRKHLEKRRS